MHNFKSVKELYKWSSSAFYLDNIATPMVFINAVDDPIVPEMLLNPIKEFACKIKRNYLSDYYINCLFFMILKTLIFKIAASHPSSLYVELSHGGHLGFYEGGLLYPNPITWLDRTLVALVGALTLANADRELKAS